MLLRSECTFGVWYVSGMPDRVGHDVDGLFVADGDLAVADVDEDYRVATDVTV